MVGLLFDRAINYFSHHVMLNSLAHAAGGFGLALLLQHYLKGNAFLPSYVGWALVVFSFVVHVIALGS